MFLSGAGLKRPAQLMTVMQLQGSEVAALTAQEIKALANVVKSEVVPVRAVDVGPSGETVFHPEVITVDPVYIEVQIPTPKKPILKTKPAPKPASEPCSDWRQLGPKSSDKAKGEAHSVRLLCVS